MFIKQAVVNSCFLIGKHIDLIYDLQFNTPLPTIQEMFDYRRMAIEFSQNLFGSILERFHSKIPKLKYPDEYTSYTRQMYHKYCQIMDNFNIFFQKMESAQERLSICQKNQFLFLQLMKISNQATNSYQIQTFIQDNLKLLPQEEYLFTFFRHYCENKNIVQRIKCALNRSEESGDIVFKIINLKKDLQDAKAVINSKTGQIKELKEIISKMLMQLSSRILENINASQGNEENKASFNRSYQIIKLQHSQIQLSMDYKTKQIASSMNLSQIHYNFVQQIYHINATLQLQKDKLSYSNQVLRDTIVRLNLQKNQLNRQITITKAIIEAQNVKKQWLIQIFIQKQQQINRLSHEILKKDKDLNQKNAMFNSYIQQCIIDKYQIYKENQILKDNINQLNQLMLENINEKNQQILNLKNDCQMLNDKCQRLQVRNLTIVYTLETNINCLTDKYEQQSKYRQQQIKILSLKALSLQAVERKLLNQIKVFEAKILQNDKIINSFSQQKEISNAKIHQFNPNIGDQKNACYRLDKYQSLEQLWLILDDENNEFTVEERIK